MAKIQNDKWYAWALTPELWVFSNEEGQDHLSFHHKHVIAFDTKEEAARRIKYFVRKCWWWQVEFETRVGTGKELTVELVKDKLRRSHAPVPHDG